LKDKQILNPAAAAFIKAIENQRGSSMRQASLRRDHAFRAAPVAGLGLIVTLAGCSLCRAQVTSCAELRSGATTLPDRCQVSAAFTARHRPEETFDHLKRATPIDPCFVEARNNLAASYLQMKNPRLAIEQLKEALRIDLDFPPLSVNLALYLENKFTEETLRYAERTSDEYPQAPLYAARTFMENNNFNRAKGEIRGYLSRDGKRLPQRFPDLAAKRFYGLEQI
jgi:tetratricopeptide (TPR) repeat protein